MKKLLVLVLLLLPSFAFAQTDTRSLSNVHWAQVWQIAEYVGIGLVIFMILAKFFEQEWWTPARIWLFLIVGSLVVYYFLGVLFAAYFFLICLAVNANSNDKILKL